MPYDARKDPQHFAGVFVNPGTGPVVGTSAENAEANMRAFVSEIGADEFGGPIGEDEGRYEFEAYGNGRSVSVEMPGLPLDEVRYVGTEDQNIWDFPRLYVDGSSWVWCYAVRSAKRALSGEDDDE